MENKALRDLIELDKKRISQMDEMYFSRLKDISEKEKKLDAKLDS